MEISIVGYKFEVVNSSILYELVTKTDIEIEESKKLINDFFGNFKVLRVEPIKTDYKKEEKGKVKIEPQEVIKLSNEEAILRIKEFLRKNSNRDFQVPKLADELNLSLKQTSWVIKRLKKEGFIYVINPLDAAIKRRFKLSENRLEDKKDNKNIEKLREGQKFIMGV